MLIGRRIAEARNKLGLSQAGLGQAIGVSGPRVSHFESGHSFPKQDLRSRIASALNADPNELFGVYVDVPDVISSPFRQRPAKQKTKIRQSAQKPILQKPDRQDQTVTRIIRLIQGMDHRRQQLVIAMIRTINRRGRPPDRKAGKR